MFVALLVALCRTLLVRRRLQGLGLCSAGVGALPASDK